MSGGAAIADGLGIANSASNELLSTECLKSFAKLCLALNKASGGPAHSKVTTLRELAESVGNVDIAAGAITRHIKFAKGKKQLLLWYILDSLAKVHPDSFGLAFGPQLQDLAIDHMNWFEPSQEEKFVKLVRSWKPLFGDTICDEIMRGKEEKQAEHEIEEREKALRKERGEPDILPDEDTAPTWDSMALVHGGVKDGQVMEYVAPCKYYLLGICNSKNCSLPHPPGQFGSRSAKDLYSDWSCRHCGYKNPGGKTKCWRRDCNGTRLDDNYISKQTGAQQNPFARQFGYDPLDEEAAVAHFKHTHWESWWADRKSKYAEIMNKWGERIATAPISSKPTLQPLSLPCQQCRAPLKQGAAFCYQCGFKQVSAGVEGEREDLLFPSTRLAVADTPTIVSAAVSDLLKVCREILTSTNPTAYLSAFTSCLQQAAHDPTYRALPRARSSVILRVC